MKALFGNKKLMMGLVGVALAAGGGGYYFVKVKGAAHTEAAAEGEEAHAAGNHEAAHEGAHEDSAHGKTAEAEEAEPRRAKHGESQHADAKHGGAKHADAVAEGDAEKSHASGEHAKSATHEGASHETAHDGGTESKHTHASTARDANSQTHAHADAEHADAGELDAADAPAPKDLIGKIKHAWHSVQAKVDRLRKAEEAAEKLTLENANLRFQLESMHMSCQSTASERRIRGVESSLTRDTGSRIGRNLAAINYKPPGNLFPEQIYTLAVSYFKANDDERAAVLFTYLTNLDENNAYKNPKDELMTGIAWYRLENFEMASEYFERVLKAENGTGAIKYQAHARLWNGLIAYRTGKHAKSQKWLTELLEHHPRSKEAAWINPLGIVRRGLASELPAETKAQTESHESHAPVKGAHADAHH